LCEKKRNLYLNYERRNKTTPSPHSKMLSDETNVIDVAFQYCWTFLQHLVITSFSKPIQRQRRRQRLHRVLPSAITTYQHLHVIDASIEQNAELQIDR
jgi:hypothetical protein